MRSTGLAAWITAALRLGGKMLIAIMAACAAPALAEPDPETAVVERPDIAPANAMIVVTAPPTDGRVLPPGVALSPEALVDRQPRSVAGALRGLPGVSVRPNSRGESVPRVRGSEERQIAVFLDGTPLVVPWDGRIDLALIPAGLVHRLEVRKGAVPIEYGTNAVAGAVDLQTRLGGDGEALSLFGTAQAGTFGIADVSGALGMRIGGADVTLAASHLSQDAARVADPDSLPFSQNRSRRRTNTQSDTTSLFGAIGRVIGPLTLRAGLLDFHARRGIAPESDRDPAVFAPRYWRYPAIDFTQAMMSAEAGLAPATTLRVVGWRQWFDQRIEAYRNVDFAALRSAELNEDDTLGGRLTFSHPAGPFRLRWSATAQTTTHVQVDTAFPPGTPGPRLRYRQTLLSLGGEADLRLGHATMLTAGIGYDRSTNPLTGDKPTQPAADAIAFSANLRHQFDDQWALTLSAGRRTRFPSARELFGEALGRFLPNFDLRPETAWLADAELTFRKRGVTATLNPFLVRNVDGIGQRVVRVGNLSLRQRYNIAGATVLGMDGLLLVSAGDWTVELTGTVLSARADPGSAAFRRLVQRPRYEATAAVDWAPAQAVDVRVELRRTGGAVDLAPDGSQARLPPSTEVNLRASVPAARFANGRRLSLTAAVDNLTDARILPQLGLPLPGRTIRLGIRIR